MKHGRQFVKSIIPGRKQGFRQALPQKHTHMRALIHTDMYTQMRLRRTLIAETQRQTGLQVKIVTVMLEFGNWEVRERETVCPCWHGRKLCKHLADEDSPWPYALNSCRKTGLLSPEGQDTQREREAGGVRVKWQRGTWTGKERRHQGKDTTGEKEREW